MIDVLNAIFLVANNGRTWSKFILSSFREITTDASAFVVPKAVKSSRDKEEVLPLRRATSWTTCTACSSRPFPIRYFGDSYRWNRKNRAQKHRNDNPPMVITKYRHPVHTLSDEDLPSNVPIILTKILLPRTISISRRTSPISQQRPGHKRSQNLSQRPKDRQHSQKILMRSR